MKLLNCAVTSVSELNFANIFYLLRYHFPMDKISCDTLVFDFNGTLVNDIDICLELLNKMLKERGHDGNISKERYFSIFTFPIIEYYRRAGFIFPEDDFNALATEFHNDYDAAFKYQKLFPDVIDVLNYFKKDKRLIVLSASRQDKLENELEMLGISKYFNAIIGIKDILGKSKINEAKEFFGKERIKPDDIIFIGDTLHDAEVAKEIGGHSILIARGHQNLEILKQSKNSIILNNLEELKNIVI